MNWNLQRFIDAQAFVYADALAELRAGSKQTHWMWFIFPQHRALGRSPKAIHFGLESLEEAHAPIWLILCLVPVFANAPTRY